ncbi:MAG: glycosyltransferase [Chitinophagales bacterium]
MENIYVVVFYIFCAAACIQFFYLLFFHLRLAIYKPVKGNTGSLPPVSIIICARNEDANLKKNLPAIFSQDYPDFEVILVDDNSEDGTTEYLFFLAQKEPRLKRTKTGNTRPMMAGKKFPLTLGLKAAAHDIVVLTDADCYPASDQWLKRMVQRYTDDAEIVLGYGAYEKRSGFLNKKIRFETFSSALQYFSFALARVPYMGVGRNLSYKKRLFFDHGGFFEHRELPSGDDDLFINKVARKRNTRIEIDPLAFTYSEPKETKEEWIEQKTRHLSTARYYKFVHKCWLGLMPLSHILFWISGFFLFAVLFPLWYVIAAAFVLRWITQRLIQAAAMRKLDAEDLIPYIELFDILQLFYYFRFAKAAMVKTKYRWN